MEATKEVTRGAIDPIVPNSLQVTTGDISPAIDPTQLADNARGVGPNNIQQEDEDLQLIPPNGIPSSVALGINFNCDVFNHDLLLRNADWKSDALTVVLDEAPQPDCPTAATDGSSLPSFENGVPLPRDARAEAPTS
ncbi:hypothetical protein R1flu_004093 [Riccia fluitans]|uniref:Uncharacterized protein n=1 Tax=Riccia fluitans TaxID=41844 RepID=A0ABD1YPA6_9MARC